MCSAIRAWLLCWLCAVHALQEIKLQQDHCADVLKDLDVPEGWHVSWNCSRDKKVREGRQGRQGGSPSGVGRHGKGPGLRCLPGCQTQPFTRAPNRPALLLQGYSGTAIISRQAPLSVSCGIGAEEHDGEVGMCRQRSGMQLLPRLSGGKPGVQSLQLLLLSATEGKKEGQSQLVCPPPADPW